MTNTAVITGAGSGVGRAIALLLAAKGWRVALIGRREEALKETMSLAGDSARSLAYPCDISNPDLVHAMAKAVLKAFGDVEVLINAAGTNTPARSLKELPFDKYRELLDTNLTGPYLCVQAFLPVMRERGSGTIINIVSDAAKQASAKAGPAYVASKFALLGLTQSINAEERVLDKRPAPPSMEARQKMLQSDDVAQCAWLAISLPDRAVVEELVIRPR